jgi:hypothetical protein
VGDGVAVDDDGGNEQSLSCFYIKKKKPKETPEEEEAGTVLTCEVLNIPPKNTIVIAASLEEAYDESTKEYADLFDDGDTELDDALKRRDTNVMKHSIPINYSRKKKFP